MPKLTMRRLLVTGLALVQIVAIESLARAESTGVPSGRPTTTTVPAPTSQPGAATIYEAERRNVAASTALELVCPGAGSLYAGDAAGAGMTWLGLGAGAGLAFWGLPLAFAGLEADTASPRTIDHVELRMAALLGGAALMLGARIYGTHNAVAATNRYNARLRTSLEVAPAFSFATDPAADSRIAALMPGVAGRF